MALIPKNRSLAELDWPKIEGIDSARASDIFNENQELFDRILRRFVDNSPEYLMEIITQLKSNNSRIAVEILHKLRGMAGNMGAMELYSKATRFEEALKCGQDDVLIAQNDFEVALRNLLASINKWLVEVKSTNMSSKCRGLTIDELKVLRHKIVELEALLSMNMARACQSSRFIVLLLKDTPHANVFNSVHEIVESYDFPRALKALDHLKLQEPFLNSRD